MFYRIQSLYFAAAFILISLNIRIVSYWKLTYFKLSKLETPQYILLNGFEIHGQSIWVQGQFFFVAILLVIISIIIFVNILLFNNRNIQKKITISAIGLVALLILILYFSVQSFKDELIEKNIVSTPITGMPIEGFFMIVFACIFLFLAYRSVNADEELVKSVDRIR